MSQIVKLERSEDLFLTLTPEMLNHLGVKEGDSVSLKVENNELVIQPLEKVEIELDDLSMLTLALMAHEKNITLNQLMINILQEQLEKATPKSI